MLLQSESPNLFWWLQKMFSGVMNSRLEWEMGEPSSNPNQICTNTLGKDESIYSPQPMALSSKADWAPNSKPVKHRSPQPHSSKIREAMLNFVKSCDLYTPQWNL